MNKFLLLIPIVLFYSCMSSSKNLNKACLDKLYSSEPAGVVTSNTVSVNESNGFTTTSKRLNLDNSAPTVEKKMVLCGLQNVTKFGSTTKLPVNCETKASPISMVKLSPDKKEWCGNIDLVKNTQYDQDHVPLNDKIKMGLIIFLLFLKTMVVAFLTILLLGLVDYLIGGK